MGIRKLIAASLVIGLMNVAVAMRRQMIESLEQDGGVRLIISSMNANYVAYSPVRNVLQPNQDGGVELANLGDVDASVLRVLGDCIRIAGEQTVFPGSSPIHVMVLLESLYGEDPDTVCEALTELRTRLARDGSNLRTVSASVVLQPGQTFRADFVSGCFSHRMDVYTYDNRGNAMGARQLIPVDLQRLRFNENNTVTVVLPPSFSERVYSMVTSQLRAVAGWFFGGWEYQDLF
ncbi:MAG: hypothetical protein LBJ69_01880 [Holosporales bacterium]|nr:hypothetical protein [Holosporales bacterium]